eukprot:9640947-Alexandrium_andersonii.AAC.1
MGLLESVPSPPAAQSLPRRVRPRASAHADGTVGSVKLQNRFSPLCDSFGRCACTETHALFEESAESEVLMPLLDPKKMKPEYQGYKRLQIAIDSGASATVIPEGLLNGHKVKPSEGSRMG